MTPGTVLVQRYQANASERVVLATTPNPEIVLVWELPNGGPRLVHTWAHSVLRTRVAGTGSWLNNPAAQKEVLRWIFGGGFLPRSA